MFCVIHMIVYFFSHNFFCLIFFPILFFKLFVNLVFSSGTGEKNVLVQYSSNTSSQSGNNICVNASLIEHLNNFGTCIPPPNVSGQYFVGNVIRPSNLSTQIPIFGNPSLPILSRLPISPNTNTFSKGKKYVDKTLIPFSRLFFISLLFHFPPHICIIFLFIFILVELC